MEFYFRDTTPKVCPAVQAVQSILENPLESVSPQEFDEALRLIRAFPHDPALAKEQERLQADPFRKLGYLERAMESVGWMGDELLNHVNPAIRSQANELMHAFAHRMQEQTQKTGDM